MRFPNQTRMTSMLGVQKGDDGVIHSVVTGCVGMSMSCCWKWNLATGRGIDGIGSHSLAERDQRIRDLEAKGFVQTKLHTDAEIAAKTGLALADVPRWRSEAESLTAYMVEQETQMIAKMCSVL